MKTHRDYAFFRNGSGGTYGKFFGFLVVLKEAEKVRQRSNTVENFCKLRHRGTVELHSDGEPAMYDLHGQLGQIQNVQTILEQSAAGESKPVDRLTCLRHNLC